MRHRPSRATRGRQPDGRSRRRRIGSSQSRRRSRFNANLAAARTWCRSSSLPLVAAICGSLVTVAALMATDHIGESAAVTQPSPTPPSPLLRFGPATAETQPTCSGRDHSGGAEGQSGRGHDHRQERRRRQSRSQHEGIGSGIIYDSNGFVLTNRHVVSDATDVTVELNDGRTVDGTVYGIDTLTDLAIVKINATDLPAAPIGDSSQLKPGQTAIVIGSALGTFTNSVTSGVVSALGRSLVVADPVNGAAATSAQPHPD